MSWLPMAPCCFCVLMHNGCDDDWVLHLTGSRSSAQEAARAAFAKEKDDAFYSSEEDDDSHSATSLSTTTSNAGPKFKVSCLRVRH